MTPRRAPILVAVIVLLLGAALADRIVSPPGRAVALQTGPVMPSPAPAGALSSTWYCAAGSAQADSPLAESVSIANPGSRPLTATIVVLTTDPKLAPPPKSIDLPPLSVRVVDLAADTPATGAAGVVVQLDGGEAVVGHSIGKPAKTTDACSTGASDAWYFADGSTAKDATLQLALFNPFPEDAIADLSFVTDQGKAVPADFQGLVVAARTVRMVDVGQHVRRRDTVASTVTARSGRLVVDQVLTRTAAGFAGTSLTRGATAVGSTWYLPNGVASATVTDTLVAYNPSVKEAQLDVTLSLDKGSAEPFELTVPAVGTVRLDLNHEARIPKDTPFSMTVTTTNGVPVVVQRIFVAAPPNRSGRSDTIAAARTSRRWALPVGAASDATDEWVTVQNPGRRPATLSIAALAEGQLVAIEGLQQLTVPAGGHASYRLGDHIKRDPLSVVVQASQPVVVEGSLFAVVGEGVTGTMAIPLP